MGHLPSTINWQKCQLTSLPWSHNSYQWSIAENVRRQGKAEAAIRLERLWGELAKTYDADTLCAYPRGSFQGVVGSNMFETICAEHSAVNSR
jgi:hypothetical protein